MNSVAQFFFINMQVKFISSHQAEIQYARSMLLKITAPRKFKLCSVNWFYHSKVGLESNKKLHLCVLVGKASRNTVNPAQPEEPAVIDGQTRVLSNAEYVHDD